MIKFLFTLCVMHAHKHLSLSYEIKDQWCVSVSCLRHLLAASWTAWHRRNFLPNVANTLPVHITKHSRRRKTCNSLLVGTLRDSGNQRKSKGQHSGNFEKRHRFRQEISCLCSVLICVIEALKWYLTGLSRSNSWRMRIMNFYDVSNLHWKAF